MSLAQVTTTNTSVGETPQPAVTAPSGVTPAQPAIPPFSVREVYKAGWLRRTSTRGAAPFGKKYERLWALFCIHDDVQPFLEFYTDPKASASHQPFWATCLSQCAHISPTIAVQGDTFEFAIVYTAESSLDALRLGVGAREQMNEWVDVLRNRLRDIGVIDPKDNFYSPLPETKPHQHPQQHHHVVLSATRDPTSPLPLPPPPPPVTVAALAPSPAHSESSTDVVYADTVPLLGNSAEEGPLEHVTVIAVNEDADDAFAGPAESDASAASGAFSTRLRINSAPSSHSVEEEHSYETIFTPCPTPPPPLPPATARPPRQTGRLPELPPPNPSQPTAEQQQHETVQRTASQQLHPRRDGLRRTVSVGGPPTVLPVLLPPAPARRRDGIVLLPRPPPPLFVAAPPPLAGPRHGSPLFRPIPAHSSALQPVPVNHANVEGGGGAYSLKERQVARLRMEMQHPAGVRILLKKKDCVNTIALIDALGTVWIGGWRQKDKPLLYNVFHIGDQVMRVGHCPVSCSADVNRIIKNDGSAQIEFVVRRMPFGRVFHLRREAEGQALGLVTEAIGAEVREVTPGGLAAQQGVPPLAISPLTTLPCSWTLTEINGRPLNLCSKEAEARDRLNAVGKAVSVLLQPTDFVKVLKRQLKGLRGYKDYLLG